MNKNTPMAEKKDINYLIKRTLSLQNDDVNKSGYPLSSKSIPPLKAYPNALYVGPGIASAFIFWNRKIWMNEVLLRWLVKQILYINKRLKS